MEPKTEVLPLERFYDFLDERCKSYAKAARGKKIDPSVRIVNDELNRLMDIRTTLTIFTVDPSLIIVQDVPFVVLPHQREALTEKIKTSMENISASRDELETIAMQALAMIDIHLLPDDLLDRPKEKMYLSKAKFVGYGRIKTEGFQIIQIRYEQCEHCNNNIIISAETLTEYGLPSLERAIERFYNPKILERFVIIEGANHFDLLGTSVPIAANKYLEKMMKQLIR
jgi:hypothetical protein